MQKDNIINYDTNSSMPNITSDLQLYSLNNLKDKHEHEHEHEHEDEYEDEDEDDDEDEDENEDEDEKLEENNNKNNNEICNPKTNKKNYFKKQPTDNMQQEEDNTIPAPLKIFLLKIIENSLKF